MERNIVLEQLRSTYQSLIKSSNDGALCREITYVEDAINFLEVN